MGKAELVDAIIRDMNRWQGFSIGLAKQLAWLDGSLHKHQAAVHQAGLSTSSGHSSRGVPIPLLLIVWQNNVPSSWAGSGNRRQ